MLSRPPHASGHKAQADWKGVIKGYVERWWQDYATGAKTWDVTIECKCGGVPVNDVIKSPRDCEFTLSSMSSVMSLIATVVGHVKRKEEVPPHLVTAFKSLRVTWVLDASRAEIVTMKAAEKHRAARTEASHRA